MKKKIIYALAMLLFGLYIVFSSQIVARLSGNYFIDSGSDITEQFGQTVSYAFDSMYDDDKSVFERVSFNGWAYCQGSDTNENKKIGIALMDNKGKLFLFKAAPNYERPDIERHSAEPGVHGFDFSISTVLVPSGQYSVLVYCSDDGENEGIVDTGYVLHKDGKQLSLRKWQSSTIEKLVVSSVAADAEYNIDIKKVREKKNTDIAGWAYIPGREAAKQEVFILLTFDDGTTTVFDTRKSNRPDVAEHFSNDMYSMSGFSAIIPPELLHSQDFICTVLVRDDDGLHTSQDMLEAAQAGLSAISK